MTTIAPADAAPIAETPSWRSLPRRDDGFDRYLERATQPADSEPDADTRADTGSLDGPRAHSVERRDRDRRRAADNAQPTAMQARADGPVGPERRDDTAANAVPSSDHRDDTKHTDTGTDTDTTSNKAVAVTVAASAAMANAAADASTSTATSAGALPTAASPTAAPDPTAPSPIPREVVSSVATDIAANTPAPHAGALDAATNASATLAPAPTPDATTAVAAPRSSQPTTAPLAADTRGDQVAAGADDARIAPPSQHSINDSALATTNGDAPANGAPASQANGASPASTNGPALAAASATAASQTSASDVQVLATSASPTAVTTPNRTTAPVPVDGGTPAAAAARHDDTNKAAVLETPGAHTASTGNRSSLVTARRDNAPATPTAAAGANIADTSPSTSTSTLALPSTGGPGGAHATNAGNGDITPGSHAQAAAAIGALGATSTPALRTVGADVDPTAVAARPAPVAEQVLDAVLPLRDRGDGDYHVKLELRPAELGRVELTVELHDGVLSVHMHADNPRSQELLQRQLDHMRDMLSDRGVRTGTLDVDQHRGQAAGGNDRHGDADDRNTRGRGADGATASATATDRVARTLRTHPSSVNPADGRLDLHV